MTSETAGFPSKATPSYCRPLLFERAQENELSRRLYRVLLRWIRYADEQFAEWDERPRCGHFFGGSYWYELETAYTAMVYASAGKLGEYDSSLTGQPREVLVEKAIMSLRYLCFTHDTGPEELVRTEGRNPFCSKQKWGGRDDGFFRASQTGTSINAIGYTAWLLWDDLDDETRVLLENVLVYYADRWSFDEEPRNGVYYNTQCEENAWTAAGIGAAAALFPQHPHHAKWTEAAERWAINAVSTVKDQLLRGQQVLTTTFHPDFTSENHGFVHPSYMFAGVSLRGTYALLQLMGGETISEAFTLNNVPMYERTIKQWSLLDGYPVPVQGQDWWYNRHHEALEGHAFMNVLHQDADAALLERLALEHVEHIQASNTRGCMLEENGESCIITAASFQTAVDMEFASAHSVLITYLLHVFGGAGEVPTDPSVFRRQVSGVQHYPYGSIVTHRTEEAFSSFSWRSHVMAVTLPKKSMWSVTPLYASYVGEVEFEGEPPGKANNEIFVLDAVRERIQPCHDGFGATAELKRGSSGQLIQRIGFLSLPNGQSVYAEFLEITQPCAIKRLSTGIIGIRNENYSQLTELAKGHKVLHSAHGAKSYPGFYGKEPNVFDLYEPSPWVNVNDEIGYVIFGSEGFAYLNQHEYPKWKGVEDVLTLNERKSQTFDTPEELPGFVVWTLPNSSAGETAAAAANVIQLSVDASRLAVLETPEYLIVIYTGSEPTSFAASYPAKKDQLFTGSLKLFEGRQRLTREGVQRFGRVTPGEASYLPCRFELKLVEEGDWDAIGCLEAIVSGGTVVMTNHTECELKVRIQDMVADRNSEIQLLAGATQVWRA